MLKKVGGGEKLLDLGCGNGDSSKKLTDMGFNVTACDMDSERFEHKDTINFVSAYLDNKLPFEDNTFDYVIFLEVIEHIYNPDFVVKEISRILKPGGQLILSTPNILNANSRFRFLFEGSFDFFREPILDYHQVFPFAIQNMHVIPWRIQELEYLLFKNSLHIQDFYADRIKLNMKVTSLLLKPFIWIQNMIKENRSKKKGGINYSRINKILLSDELMCGRHIILRAEKKA